MASKSKPTTVHVQTPAKSIKQAIANPKAHVKAANKAAK
jgi:predicted transcriptional regulator of viral defense system